MTKSKRLAQAVLVAAIMLPGYSLGAPCAEQYDECRQEGEVTPSDCGDLWEACMHALYGAELD